LHVLLRRAKVLRDYFRCAAFPGVNFSAQLHFDVFKRNPFTESVECSYEVGNVSGNEVLYSATS